MVSENETALNPTFKENDDEKSYNGKMSKSMRYSSKESASTLNPSSDLNSISPIKEYSDQEDSDMDPTLKEDNNLQDEDIDSLNDPSEEPSDIEAIKMDEEFENINSTENSPQRKDRTFSMMSETRFQSKSRSVSVVQTLFTAPQKQSSPVSPSMLSSGSHIFSSWCWKEGGRIKSWKRRYFKLTNDYLTYGKNFQTILSKLPVDIITSITPNNQNGAPSKFREFGWRMTVKQNRKFREYVIVAESKTEYDIWMKIIQKKVNDSQNLNLSELFKKVLQDEQQFLQLNSIINEGLSPEFINEKLQRLLQIAQLRDRSIGFSIYKKCISGSELIIAIQKIFQSKSMFECLLIGNILIQQNIIEGLLIPGKNELIDDKNIFYRFKSIEERSSTPVSDSPRDKSNTPTETKNFIPIYSPQQKSLFYPDQNSSMDFDIKSEKSNKFQSRDGSDFGKLRIKNSTSFSNDVNKKEKIRSNVNAVKKAIDLFSENISRLEFLNTNEASKIYTADVRQQKIDNRYKVAISQRDFIQEQITETMEYETVRLKKVKREIMKSSAKYTAKDELLTIEEQYKSREMRFKENINRIKKLQQQFTDLDKRFKSIEQQFALRVKRESAPKFFQMLKEENKKWDEIEYEEIIETNPTNRAVIPQIKVKGRGKQKDFDSGGNVNSITGGNQVSALKLDDSKILLRDEMNITMDLIEEYQKERNNRLLGLEMEANGLIELFKDLNGLVKENQVNLDLIENNVISINENIVKGTENVLSAKNNLPSSQIKNKIDSGIGKANTLFKWTGFL